MPKPLTPSGNRAKPRSTQPHLIESAPSPAAKSDRAGGNRPVKEFRHRSLRATIWKNDTDKGVMYNVTLTRMYRDGEKWKDSQSFGFDDLMNLAKLLADAHTYISVLRDKERLLRDLRDIALKKLAVVSVEVGIVGKRHASSMNILRH